MAHNNAKNDFGVSLTATLNTSNVPKAIEKLNADLQKSTTTKVKLPVEIDKDGNLGKLKLNLDTKELEEQIEKGKVKIKDFYKEVNILKDKAGNTFKDIKILDIAGNVKSEEIKQVTSAVQTLTTETQKFANENGDLVTLTTTVNNLGKEFQTQVVTHKELGSTVQETTTLVKDSNNEWIKVGETLKDVSAIVGETGKSTLKYKDDTGAVVTEIHELTKAGEQLKTIIKEEVAAEGEIVKTTELWNEASNTLLSTHKETLKDEIKLEEQQRKLQQSLVETSKVTNKVKRDSGEIVTTIEEVNKSGEKIFTTITEIDNGLGTLTTKTEKYKKVENEQGQIEKQIIDLHTETINDQVKIIEGIEKQTEAQRKLNEITVKSETSTKKGKVIDWESGKQYEGLITTIKSIDKEGKETTKTIEKFTDAEGRLIEQTQTLDNEQRKVANNTRIVSDGFKEATKETRTFGQALSDAISRLAKYYIASLPIQMVRKGISEAITTIKEFDSALIEFRKVSDLAGESLTNYVAKLAEMGEVTGSTMQAMVEASTEFRKSGFSDEDSAKLASIAEKYRNIADEEISAGESASFIIAQMKAFNIEADQAEHIIDSVNEVANNFSVSSADLATNLGNMSAIMAINNVSMEEQIGMLTGVTEITRNASSASRGLVMISSRLTQVLDESSSTGKKLTAIYNELGIELKDEEGQLRSHYDILGDLALQWDSLSENQQKYIALTSAGARQQQNFVALMENWSQVAKATTTAYQSMGSAQKENEKVMDSVAKKVEILKSQFQQLVIGKGSLQNAAKAILNLGIAFLKFANSDIGQVIIKLTLLAATFKALNLIIHTTLVTNIKNLATTFVGLISYLMNVAIANGIVTTSFGAVIAAVHTLTYALAEMAFAWAATPMGMISIAIAGIATAVIAGNQALEKYNARLKDASDRLDELSSEAKNAKSELDGLNDQLENIRKQIKDNSVKIKLVDPEEAEKIKEENEELEKQERTLERQVALQEQKLALAEKEAEEQAKVTLKTTTQSYWETGKVDDGTGTYAGTYKKDVTPAEELENATQKYRDLENQIRSLEEVQKNEANAGREQGQVYQNTAQKITELTAEQDKAKERGIEMSNIVLEGANNLKSADSATQEYKNNLLGLVDNFQSATGYSKEFNDENKDTQEGIEETTDELSEEEIAIQQLAKAHNVAAEDLKDWAKELGISEEALVNYADALGVSVEKAYEFKTQLESWNEQIDLLQSSFDALKGAVDEYNSSQELSLDTVQALLNLDPQYLTCLEEENGQLVLNEQKIMDKVNALVEERKQIAINIAHERLRKVEIGESAEAEVDHQGKVENNTDAIRKETAALKENTIAYGAKIVAESNGEKKAAVDKIINELKQELSMLDKIGDSYSSISSKASKAGKSAKSAGKAATDAAKEAKKELEDLIKKYEQVIKYINKRYDREIKKIKDAKSDAIKAEEKKIKAKEKEKDHALDAIEKEIKALKKEQDARKKYWSDRIDALKKQNDALKDSLELQEKLDALEKARNTKVKIYKEGQGFVYDVDQTAVAKAQKELDEYLSQKAYEDELERLEALKDAELDNYEKRLDALNEYKDSVQENYEKQIEQMNEYKDQLSEQYDAQIDKWEEYKEQFGDLVDQYEEQQNKLLFEQLMGIKDENSNWLTRLDNLAEFVRKYNELQNKLNTGDTSVTNTAKMKEGTGGGSGTRNTNYQSTKPSSTAQYDSRGFRLNEGYSSTSSSSSSKVAYVPTSVAKQLGGSSGRITTHANGTPSVKSDEIAVVGENPNKEIVIGSKINNGELMNLGKGTGVVNADSSKTLAGMLNQVGQFGASGFGSGNGTLNNNINNDSLVINGVTVQGANIKDPETFVNGLLNLKAEALQRAYRHR